MKEKIENGKNDDDKNFLISNRILLHEFEKSEEDIKAGRTIDYSDFKEKLAIMYNIQI
ncbi:hypothetical protein [Flavobacterium sp. FlaQc-47]|uniref:hypothetical protein n=1 Tax=Flavobacterium sp. FlaQc-47 TaxID=3374180 RepID=UPI003757F300